MKHVINARTLAARTRFQNCSHSLLTTATAFFRGEGEEEECSFAWNCPSFAAWCTRHISTALYVTVITFAFLAKARRRTNATSALIIKEITNYPYFFCLFIWLKFLSFLSVLSLFSFIIFPVLSHISFVQFLQSWTYRLSYSICSLRTLAYSPQDSGAENIFR